LILLAWLTRSQIAVWKDSTTLYRHATEVTRENHFAHRFLGVALWNQGQTREAEAQLLEALRIRPTWGDAHLVLATAYLQQGRLAEASTHLDRARENGADAARVWAARGILADQRGDETEAARAYQKSLSLDPDDWEVANNLAWIRASSRSAELRDPQQALVLSERALAQRPEDPFVLGTRAGALAAARRAREAVGVQQRALDRLAEAGMRSHRPAFEARLAHYRSGGTPSDFRWSKDERRASGPPVP
jgi:tetratricopeptide (TPR) repeat protein